MLDIMRKKKESSIIIKIVFVIIVLSFIGTMFLVWGEGRQRHGRRKPRLRGQGRRQKDNPGGVSELLPTHRNVYQQIYGQSLPPEMEKMLGLKKVALDTLIDNRLIMKEAKSMDIKVTKDDIAAAIAAMPDIPEGRRVQFRPVPAAPEEQSHDPHGF